MPIAYDREDPRRLITVTVTEPYSVDDILSVVDWQASEETWEYAILYDMRAVTHTLNEADLRRVADRVRAIGGGNEPGPVGIVGARPETFRMALMYTALTRKLVNVEALLTSAQLDGWLARNAGRRALHDPQSDASGDPGL